jgi:hypothetical protein
MISSVIQKAILHQQENSLRVLIAGSCLIRAHIAF